MQIKQYIEKREEEFDEYGIGRYTSEYSYEHRIPNYDKIKKDLM